MTENLPQRGGPMFIDPLPHDGVLAADAEVHPGFGIVTLCRDGVQVARDVTGERNLRHYTETVARATRPGHAPSVWTLHIDGPFRSLVYAFTPPGEWRVIDHKDGFA